MEFFEVFSIFVSWESLPLGYSLRLVIFCRFHSFFRVFQARIVKYEANAKRTQSTSRVRDLFLLPIILRINQTTKKKNCLVLRGDYIQTFKLSDITCIHLFRVTFPFNSGAEVRRGAASTSGGRGDRRW